MAMAAVQLRLRRKERGWTLEDVVDRLHSLAHQMGEPVPGVDRQAVSRWERGTHRPRAHYVRLLSILYQASPLDLGLVDQVEEQASVVHEPHAAMASSATILEPIGRSGVVEDDVVADLTRRSMLQVLAAGGAALVVDLPDVAHGVANASWALDEQEFITAQHGSAFWRISVASFLEYVADHQKRLQRRLGSAHGVAARRLMVMLSQSAVFASLAAHRRRDYGIADEHSKLAHRLAVAAGDTHSEAMVLAARRPLVSTTGEGGRERARESLALSEAALERAGEQADPLLLTWLHCSRSQDAAALGHEREALHSIEEAERFFAVAGQPGTGFFDHWDLNRIQGWRASSLLFLDRPGEAVRTLEAVARSTPHELPAPRAAVLADLGEARAIAGEPEGAIEDLLSALSTARGASIQTTVHRIRRARSQHLPDRKTLLAVEELDEALAV